MGFIATSRRTRRALSCAPLLCTLAALPTAALARGARAGGSGIGVSGGGASSSLTTSTGSSHGGSTNAAVVRISGVVNASGDGITLSVAASGIRGHPLTITGMAATTDAGAQIEIEATRAGRADWSEVATARIAPSGAFTAQWIPPRSAQMALRAVLAPGTADAGGGNASGGGGLLSALASTASSELATSALTIPIFGDARATFYGPGFWGHRTACGERLRHGTLGVASRTLKCGTRVAVYFRGRELTVPVIDRGPFANHARWDLTMATARALGIRETVMLGTLAPAPTFALASRS